MKKVFIYDLWILWGCCFRVRRPVLLCIRNTYQHSSFSCLCTQSLFVRIFDSASVSVSVSPSITYSSVHVDSCRYCVPVCCCLSMASLSVPVSLDFCVCSSIGLAATLFCIFYLLLCRHINVCASGRVSVSDPYLCLPYLCFGLSASLLVCLGFIDWDCLNLSDCLSVTLSLSVCLSEADAVCLSKVSKYIISLCVSIPLAPLSALVVFGLIVKHRSAFFCAWSELLAEDFVETMRVADDRCSADGTGTSALRFILVVYISVMQQLCDGSLLISRASPASANARGSYRQPGLRDRFKTLRLSGVWFGS